MKHLMTISDYLQRNGVIIERARRAGRSLTHIEQSIILSGRYAAAEKNITREQWNAEEMAGERNKHLVFAPIKILAVFDYYDEPFEEIEANPAYLVIESNHPALTAGSHVCADQLRDVEQKVPKTPTYEKWVRQGKPRARS